MVSNDYSEAMVEVLDIIDHLEDDTKNKIPQKLIDFWNENKSKTYRPEFDHSVPIKEMKLKKKTKTIIAMIYLNYFCDAKEKEELKKQLIKNDEVVKEKYDINKIFDKPKEKEIKESDKTTAIAQYKEPLFNKIIKKIKEFFKI